MKIFKAIMFIGWIYISQSTFAQGLRSCVEQGVDEQGATLDKYADKDAASLPDPVETSRKQYLTRQVLNVAPALVGSGHITIGGEGRKPQAPVEEKGSLRNAISGKEVISEADAPEVLTHETLQAFRGASKHQVLQAREGFDIEHDILLEVTSGPPVDIAGSRFQYFVFDVLEALQIKEPTAAEIKVVRNAVHSILAEGDRQLAFCRTHKLWKREKMMDYTITQLKRKGIRADALRASFRAINSKYASLAIVGDDRPSVSAASATVSIPTNPGAASQ